MSRAGYSDDYEESDDPTWTEAWEKIRKEAIYGERGQKFLRDLRDSLDAMPVKRLITGELKDTDGEVCALGCIGVRRGVDMAPLLKPADCDQEDWDSDWENDAADRAEDLGKMFDIDPVMAQEVMYQNDECDVWHHAVTGAVIKSYRGEAPPIRYEDTPEERWDRMRRWVGRRLGEESLAPKNIRGGQVSNPFAVRLSEASVLMEDTTHPELADMLRLGANEIERLQREVNRLTPKPQQDCPRAPTPFRYCPDCDGSFPCELPGRATQNGSGQ